MTSAGLARFRADPRKVRVSIQRFERLTKEKGSGCRFGGMRSSEGHAYMRMLDAFGRIRCGVEEEERMAA